MYIKPHLVTAFCAYHLDNLLCHHAFGSVTPFVLRTPLLLDLYSARAHLYLKATHPTSVLWIESLKFVLPYVQNRANTSVSEAVLGSWDKRASEPAC